MIIIGTGSREWTNYKPIAKVMRNITNRYGLEFMYYHGGARGFDQISQYQLKLLKHRDRDIRMFPYISELGFGGGMARNRQMLAEALLNELPHDILLIAMPLPNSIGTHGMINISRQAHINVEIYDQYGELIDL